MNTFFRIAVYFCFLLLICTLMFNVVSSLGAFGFSMNPGQQIGDTDEALGDLTTLETPNMNYIIILVTSGVGVGIFAGWLTHSIVPVGISVFGSVFWASYINTHTIISYGQYIPSELLTIFTICTGLIFIAAIVGMLTGSG